MSVEYEIEKKEALERLSAACSSNLKRLQENNVQAEFSFKDYWGWMKQDSSTHPQTPVFNQLSRVFLNFHQDTWVTYTYRDGNLSAELFQHIKSGPKLVQAKENVSVEDIPFSKFFESYLVSAAREIEIHLPSEGNSKSQVA